MEAVLIVLAVFSTPVAIIGMLRHYRYKERQLAAGMSGSEQKALLARCEELEQRIQTLETIACEGDLDAAVRLRRLASPKDGGALPAAPRLEE